MKIKLILLFLLLSVFIPFNVKAISNNYIDVVKDIVNKDVDEDKVAIYFFHGYSCPHCHEENEFLTTLENLYGDKIEIFKFETYKMDENKELLLLIKEKMGLTKTSNVPFTVVGDKSFVGYSDAIGDRIEIQLREYLELDTKEETINAKKYFKLPLIGKVNVYQVSLPIIAIVLGLADGFNPCAMWILLFLINMLFGMKDKKKMFLYGYVFLFTSALVYFLSMLGINIVLEQIKQLQILIAVVAIIVGIINIKKFIVTKDDGCHIVDNKKRKKIFARINKFINEKNIILALGGVIALAISVNIVELACSAAFPAIYAEILALNNVTGLTRIIYLIVYCLFYMLDDMIVFTIAVCTLSIKTTSTKYTKYSSLICGILMILMGILLIFKPEIIMLNF